MTPKEFLEKYTWAPLEKPVAVTGKKPIHVLLEHDTGRLLCLSHWNSTINALQESTLNTTTVYWINHLFSPGITADQPWLYAWSPEKQLYVKNDRDFSENELSYYFLITEKSAAIDLIHRKIYLYRRYMYRDLLMQHTIYSLKAQEAQEILALESIPEDGYRWPLVYDYAELCGIDIKRAAEEIVLQNKLFKSRMSNTETLRIKYIRQIHQAQQLMDIKTVISGFLVEGELYGKL